MIRTKSVKVIDKFWLTDSGRSTFYNYLKDREFIMDFYQYVIEHQDSINYNFGMDLID